MIKRLQGQINAFLFNDRMLLKFLSIAITSKFEMYLTNNFTFYLTLDAGPIKTIILSLPTSFEPKNDSLLLSG